VIAEQVAEVHISLVKLVELAQIGLAQTEVVQTEVVETELVWTKQLYHSVKALVTELG